MPKTDKPLITKMWPSRSQIFLGSCKQGKLCSHHFTGPQHESPCMALCNATLLPLPPTTVTTSPIHCDFAAMASREELIPCIRTILCLCMLPSGALYGIMGQNPYCGVPISLANVYTVGVWGVCALETGSIID